MLTCYSTQIHIRTSGLRLYRMATQIQRQMSSSRSYMIVGLGNDIYPDTRHSVGMRAADQLAEWLGAQWSRQRALQSVVATARIPEHQLHMVLVKPKTLMNINGKSIHKAAQHYGIDPTNIYLMHDEIDKPVGAVKMKNGGSARGHNGVRSTIASLKSDVMPRLLIGIDRPANKNQVAEYVLQKFRREEIPIVHGAILEGLSKLFCHVQSHAGIEGDLFATIRKMNRTTKGS